MMEQLEINFEKEKCEDEQNIGAENQQTNKNLKLTNDTQNIELFDLVQDLEGFEEILHKLNLEGKGRRCFQKMAYSILGRPKYKI